MKIKKRDGSFAWVGFKYERLHVFCFYCGLLGHQAKFCAKATLSNASPDQYAYGPELRAPQRRPNSNIGAGWLVTGPPSKDIRRKHAKEGEDSTMQGVVRFEEESEVVCEPKRKRVERKDGSQVSFEVPKSPSTAGAGSQPRPSQ